MDSLNMEALQGTITELVSTWGIKVVGALALIIVGFIVAKIIRGWVARILRKANLDATLIPFLSKLAYYLVLTVVILAALQLFGVETTSLVAVLGAGTLAVGLALQGTLSNFSAGVMLLAFRPFRVGDYIEAGDAGGTVKEIGVFSTHLDTLDNTHVVLPNSAIWGAKISNLTANPTRRNDMSIGVSYGDDINKAREIILETLRADDRVLAEPAPAVAVEGLGDSSIDLLVMPWCHPDHYWDLRWDMFQRIKENLEKGGCSIPFPQRDVHLFKAN